MQTVSIPAASTTLVVNTHQAVAGRTHRLDQLRPYLNLVLGIDTVILLYYARDDVS